MPTDKAKVLHLLKEVRSTSGRDSDRAASKLLDYVRSSKSGNYSVKAAGSSMYVKRAEDPRSGHKGEFMGVKKDGRPFKGIAKESDKGKK